VSFDWAGYLAVARELAGQTPATPPSQEAKLRAANSRAYYAAYWSALTHLRDHDGDTSLATSDVPSVHAYVRDQYRYGARDRIRRQIGEDLSRLLASRRRADYSEQQLNSTRLFIETRDCLEMAARIIRDLQTLQRGR
jgi:hypothetical protein